jgi:Family of unknown function (DUF6346)
MDPMEPAAEPPKEQPSRLHALGECFLMLGVAFLFWALVATGGSLYAGTGSRFGYSKDQAVTADIEACHRRGPVSFDGLGYWWSCTATVRTPDGRTTHPTLRHSIARPADVGTTIKIRERCGNDNSDCSYGLSRPYVWGVLLRILSVVEILTIPFLLYVALLLFLGAVLTERAELRVRRLLGKLVGKKYAPTDPGPTA